MKQIVLLAVAVLLGVINCQAQVKEENTAKGDENPKTNITVNKEYDDQGNLIKYDSTYSYSYSNTDADSLSDDSIFNVFRDQFNHRFNFSEDPFFKDFFFQDSVMNDTDFLDDDFFIKRFKDNMDQMEDLFQQMDSVKNNFFRREYDKSVKPQFQSL
jgi:hypothetical protein